MDDISLAKKSILRCSTGSTTSGKLGAVQTDIRTSRGDTNDRGNISQSTRQLELIKKENFI